MFNDFLLSIVYLHHVSKTAMPNELQLNRSYGSMILKALKHIGVKANANPTDFAWRRVTLNTASDYGTNGLYRTPKRLNLALTLTLTLTLVR